MKIKRFFAADIRQAMKMVRDELGSDAVIMSNKSVDGGVEIIAARDFDEQVLEKKIPAETHAPLNKGPTKTMPDLPDYSAEKERLHIVQSPRKRDANNQTPPRAARREVDQYLGYAEKMPLKRMDSAESEYAPKATKPLNDKLNQIASTDSNFYADSVRPMPPKREVKPEVRTVNFKATPVKNSPEKTDFESERLLDQMRKEFRQLKLSMEMRLSEVGFAQVASTNPVRLDLLRRFAGMGISKKLSLKLANRLGTHANSDYAFEKAQEMMTKVMPIADDNILEYGGVIALVGPTGVGKTTTIAKLAAKFILKHGSRQVALITTDNYRIAAHEQLNTYGRILDVPVRSAANADELRSLINGFGDKKLILIDTAGMGPRDMRLVEQLRTLQKNDVPIRTYLVISATTQYKGMQEIMRAFQIAGPASCILTKMDEASSIGGAISALIEQQLPVSFVTDGQQVPEDIHVPRAQGLINQCVADIDQENDYTDSVNYEEWVAEGYA